MLAWCRHVHVRPHCFILTEACSCRLELAYFAGKISKNRLVCKIAVALTYYGSCRLLVMGSWRCIQLKLHAFLLHALPSVMSYHWYAVTTLTPLHAANTSHHVQQPPPSITSTPAKPVHSTQAANMTTIRNTTPAQTTSSHTNKPTKPVQNSSTTATPTHTTAVQQTPVGPSFGDVSQSDDSSGIEVKEYPYQTEVIVHKICFVRNSLANENLIFPW